MGVDVEKALVKLGDPPLSLTLTDSLPLLSVVDDFT